MPGVTPLAVCQLQALGYLLHVFERAKAKITEVVGDVVGNETMAARGRVAERKLDAAEEAELHDAKAETAERLAHVEADKVRIDE